MVSTSTQQSAFDALAIDFLAIVLMPLLFGLWTNTLLPLLSFLCPQNGAAPAIFGPCQFLTFFLPGIAGVLRPLSDALHGNPKKLLMTSDSGCV
jgi:hypothetical protein